MKTDPGELLPTTDGGSCLKLVPSDRCPFTGDLSQAIELRVMVFNATFNNISVLLVEEPGVTR